MVTAVDILTNLDAVFDNEKRWCQAKYEKRFLFAFITSRCMLGGVKEAARKAGIAYDFHMEGCLGMNHKAVEEATWFLNAAIRQLTNGEYNNIIAFNDADDRTFADIKEVISVARIKALAAKLMREADPADFEESPYAPELLGTA